MKIKIKYIEQVDEFVLMPEFGKRSQWRAF